MLTSNICPGFSFRTFTFIAFSFNLLVYVLCLCLGGFEPGSFTFLATNLDFLALFGENSPYFIKYRYEVLRLVGSLFLTTGSCQFLTNSVMLLVIGSNFETVTDWKTAAIVYFFSGVGGEVFSNLLTDYPTVGNAGGLMGLLGSFLSKIFYVGLTNEILRARREILILLALVILILTMVVVIFPMSQGLNLIGGFLMGMISGFALIIGNNERSIYRRYTKIFCIAVAVAFVNVGLISFFLFRAPRFYELESY